MQEQEALGLRQKLAEQFGVQFDIGGFVVNPSETRRRLYDEYNAKVDEYNNTTTEEGQEALANELENLDKGISDFEE